MGGRWLDQGWYAGPGGHRLSGTLAGKLILNPGLQARLHDTFQVTWQPGGRYWLFQFAQGGAEVLLALLLAALALWLVRRRRRRCVMLLWSGTSTAPRCSGCWRSDGDGGRLLAIGWSARAHHPVQFGARRGPFPTRSRPRSRRCSRPTGMLLGAPLLGREYEQGTFRFAWTQGTGRTPLVRDAAQRARAG